MRNTTLYIIAIAMFVIGCTKLTTTESTERELITLSVTNSVDENTTRMALEESSVGGLSVMWADENETLGGWCSTSTSFTPFVMDETTLSEDKKSALFSGEKLDGDMRLIYPYDMNPTFDGDRYYIDNSLQSIDISQDNGLGSIAQNIFMVSSQFEPSSSATPTMKNIGAIIKIGLCFDGLDESKEHRITKLLFGGNGGLVIPTTAYIDLSKEVEDEDFIEVIEPKDDEANFMSIEVEQSAIIANADQNYEPLYQMNISTLPFVISPGDTIKLEVELTDLDNAITSKRYNIVYPGSDSLNISRSTYTYINYFCAIDVEFDSTINLWDDSDSLNIDTDY